MIGKKKHNLDAAVTAQCWTWNTFTRVGVCTSGVSVCTSRVSVCTSRVSVCTMVMLDKPRKTSRVPVRICSMTAKDITITPKTNICELKEVQAIRTEDFKLKHTVTSFAAEVNEKAELDSRSIKVRFSVDIEE